MKRVKIGFFIVALIIVGIVTYQNKIFFLEKQNLSIDLYFIQYDLYLISNLSIFIFSFFSGLTISFFFAVFNKFKAVKIIRKLHSREAFLTDLVSSLRREIENSKNESSLDSSK